MDTWRVELHCHSSYSRDCRVSLEKIIAICKKRGINAIALTDHDEVEGAQHLAELAPDWLKVIVAEEIATAQGDLIGLFLKEKIEPRQSIEETLKQIHSQGGVALLPHPTDRLRHEAVGPEVARRMGPLVDAFEVFNARTVFTGDNQSAAAMAQELGLTAFVGSDAHTSVEYGRAVNIMKPFTDAQSFKESLKDATFEMKKSGIGVHGTTALVKRINKLAKKLSK